MGKNWKDKNLPGVDSHKPIQQFSFNTERVGLALQYLQLVTKEFDFKKKFRAVIDYDPERPSTRVKLFKIDDNNDNYWEF